MKPRDSGRMSDSAPAPARRIVVPALQAYLTVSDVAAWLRLRPATVRALARRGEIGFNRVGRAIRFKLIDVEAYLERQRRPARGERASTAARL